MGCSCIDLFIFVSLAGDSSNTSCRCISNEVRALQTSTTRCSTAADAVYRSIRPSPSKDASEDFVLTPNQWNTISKNKLKSIGTARASSVFKVRTPGKRPFAGYFDVSGAMHGSASKYLDDDLLAIVSVFVMPLNPYDDNVHRSHGSLNNVVPVNTSVLIQDVRG